MSKTFLFRYRTVPGLTLIETILYAGLVTIIISAFFVSMHAFTSSGLKDRERLSVIENQRFIGQKVLWLVDGAESSQVTPSSGTTSSLEVRKSNGFYYRMDLDSGQIRVTRDANGDGLLTGADPTLALTNSRVYVTGLTFERVDAASLRVIATFQGSGTATTLNKLVFFP